MIKENKEHFIRNLIKCFLLITLTSLFISVIITGTNGGYYMKKLRIYGGLLTLLTTVSLSSCKRVDESIEYNYETKRSIVSESLETKKEIERVLDTETLLVTTQSTSDITSKFEEKEPIVNKESITISFTGDCTLGTYLTSQNKAFDVLFDKQQDYAYYFQNVKNIFENDDYTVVNLEGPLTDSTNINEQKPFIFKGRPDYINILTSGGVEAANLSNNHIRDYGETGYNDTVNILKENNIAYFDNANFHIEDINGIKFGFAGFKAFNLYTKNEIDKALKYFEENNVDIKIIILHGGIEYDYDFDIIKQELAHYAIDNGADLIVGHHPHILQGVEEYNDKYIFYSLGNFCYGGHSNPNDKNSMIAQVTFNFEDDKYIDSNLKLIPVSISSVDYTNNFQPTVLEGEAKDKVLKLINDHSYNFNYID